MVCFVAGHVSLKAVRLQAGYERRRKDGAHSAARDPALMTRSQYSNGPFP
jgi:hypothetical protein